MISNTMKKLAIAIAGLSLLAPLASNAQPNDTYFVGEGSWGQSYADQWAIKRVGMENPQSVWASLGSNPSEVTVAVIDTGLDWNHADISWDMLWKNEEEIPDNGIDDDGNGYVDDIIGWNFFENSNKPWDHDGHGTFVTGIINADTNNAKGIAGMNPHARVMVLKAINNFGHSRASYLAQALYYATDNGAKIVNMSVGGKGLTPLEKEAVDYAVSKGVFIVVAAGNEAIKAEEFGIAGLENVLTVAATGTNDKRVVFSNWGAAVDVAAPGVDVLSLRARRTDFLAGSPDIEYDETAAYVGDDKRYYRASGTSFSAPIVTGAASLLLSKDPTLTHEDLHQLLTQSARDIGTPGIDQYTGYGLLDVRAALAADKGFFISALINDVQIVADGGGQSVEVLGTAAADRLLSADLFLGAGEDPTDWKPVADELTQSVTDGALGRIPAIEFAGSAVWTIRLVTTHANGQTREFRFQIDL